MADTSLPYVRMAVQPLADLLADTALTEIMIVGEQGVWVERQGVGIEKTTLRLNRLQIDGIVAHLAHLSHREADLQGAGGHAIISARFPGFRVEAQMPPVAVEGPYLSFRRHHPRAMSLQDAVVDGDLPSEVASYLRSAVRARDNVLVVGGTGSGKTTLLNALIREVDRTDVLVLIETVPELRVDHENVRRLEADDEQGYSVQRLVKSALRSRPDRILIGEVRGGEAFDFMDAANTGHPGAMGSLHANSALEGLQRFENLVLEGRPHMPLAAIRQRIGQTFDLLVHMERAPVCGRPRRRVREVVRLEGFDAARETYRTRSIHDANADSRDLSKAAS